MRGGGRRWLGGAKGRALRLERSTALLLSLPLLRYPTADDNVRRVEVHDIRNNAAPASPQSWRIDDIRERMTALPALFSLLIDDLCCVSNFRIFLT